MRFPKHACGLYLEHNAHLDYYDSIEKAHEDEGDFSKWKDAESKARSLATGELWTLQWYPDTPIGFYRIAAPTLEELLAFAVEIEASSKDVGGKQ